MCGTCKPVHKLKAVRLVPDFFGELRAVGVLVHSDPGRGFKAGEELMTSPVRTIQGSTIRTQSGTLYEVVA